MEEEVVSEDRFKQGNISLMLTSYNDIFSSFDARPFSDKAISIDFLDECKRAAIDKGEKELELILSMPKPLRIFSEEYRIKKRLKEHFHKHFLEKEKDIKRIKREGLWWIVLGVLINIIVALGFIRFESNTIHSLIGIFEVPSWFLIWEGLGKILLESRKLSSEYSFHKKMNNAKISFIGY